MSKFDDSWTKESNFQFGRWLASPPPGEEVVISGMSGRFPECDNIHEFRDKLSAKHDMISHPNTHWRSILPEIPIKRGKLNHLDRCDSGFFGMHYRQTNIMDPLMRIFLEAAIESILDAGVNPAELEGSKTGVFVGAVWSDVEIQTLWKINEPQLFGVTGYYRTFIPHRLSYYLKLKGPAYITDTACSSSLTALTMAFEAIRSGKCDRAIVGGSSLILHPAHYLEFVRLGVISDDACCKVFDQAADGYARSDGVACLFIQKSKESRRIYAQVVHSKMNSDGYKEEGITFPSWMSQKELMTEMYEESGIDPNDVSYLEAHGTGTAAGDPEETMAIDSTLAKRREKTLLVGSVKSSIGHGEGASGVSSIIKVLLAMETGWISPNIHFKKLKKGLEGFEQGRMKVVTELTELKEDDAVVGVNNFGFGGANVHVILKRFKKKKINNGLPQDDIPRLVCVSGRTEESVLKLLNNINSNNLDVEYLELLQQIYKMNIKNYCYRGYTVISKNAPIKSSVKFFTDQKLLSIYFGKFDKNYRVLASYLSNYPVFKNTISRIHEILANANNRIKECASGKQNKDILGGVWTQIGIVEIIKLLEIEPTVLWGDSWGKLLNSYYYSVLNLEETVLKAIEIVNNNFESEISLKLQNPPKKLFVLNISDSCLNKSDERMIDGEEVRFLDVLGRLYEQGHNPQLHRLYPKVEHPVSRGTPMISPLIQWHHAKSWYTYQFDYFDLTTTEHKEFIISLENPENEYIKGHVIDGRNLIPATEYLCLVWRTFAENRGLKATNTSPVFEDCKFVKAVSIAPNRRAKLTVSIQRDNDRFEVLEEDSVVVTGRIYMSSDTDETQTILSPLDFEENDPKLTIEQDDIYRELYLRGYNYSGMFKGIQNCNVDGTSGLIKWEDNWSSFMDKMLQMKILSNDTRFLYVPVGIKKITVNPIKHKNLAQELEVGGHLFPVHVYKEADVIKSGGIEILELKVKSISKKKQRLNPVLEKYEFAANSSLSDVCKSVRINSQIILENTLENNFNAIEIIDNFSNPDSDFLLPFVSSALDDLPLVRPDLTISTTISVEEPPGVKVNVVDLNSQSNLLLIIASKATKRQAFFKKISKALKQGGYILSREETDYVPENIDGFELITKFTTPNEKLILFRKSEKYSRAKIIEVSSTNFDWIPVLRKSLEQDANIIVYSQNEILSGILGMVNCIRREPSGAKVKCFFIMDRAPKFDPENVFYKNQIAKNFAFNIYQNGQWGTYRHLILEHLQPKNCKRCYANVTSAGDLSSFKWVERKLDQNVTNDQILVDTYYTALNFKDVMLATGRINVDIFTKNRIDQECALGFEFAGIDSSGRRVIGMVTNGAFSTHVIADTNLMWELPNTWSLEEGATVPVVYSTVIYALQMIAQFKSGSSILIHSATGGIGIAALNVCLHYNSDIYVTVGTKEKREFLKKHYPQIPESHIGNSRDLSFEEMIKTETKGRGVDVVLNSLSEDKLQASVRCLARGGYFLEIGKFDLANNSSLSLLSMEKEISYHGIGLDLFFKNSSVFKSKLQKAVQDGINDGFVKPLPRVVFNRKEVEAAHRYMMTGKHIGKVLMKVRETENEETLFEAMPRFNCDEQKCYIVIGGLGGFGLELADWLILRGATKIVLVSRSGIRSGYQTLRINNWKSYGVDVRVSTKDITTLQGCRDLIEEAKELGSIDGIFNLAVLLQDALFEDQTEDSFVASLAPKAQATIYLDQVSRISCPELRHFVIFSSVSCGRGNAGQTNYGMANSVMERLCEKRKLESLPAVAIQWGAIGDVGLVAKMQKENKELVIGGTLQQKIYSCLTVLDTLLQQDNPVVASMIVAEKHNKSLGSGSAAEAAAYVLGINDIKTVSHHVTLVELGMDSMMGTEISQILEKDFEIYVTPKDMRSLTFAKLSEIEDESKNKSEGTADTKSQRGTNLLIQSVPAYKNSDTSTIILESLIRDNEEAVSVIVLPGIEGTFEPLEPLTRNLKAHLIGIQYKYYDPEDTIEEMAKNILPHIKEYLTRGRTFVIIGYSFGAVVGIEVVKLLENEGYSGKIISIDGSPAYLGGAAREIFSSETGRVLETNFVCKIASNFVPIDIVLSNKENILNCEDLNDRLDLMLQLVSIDNSVKGKLEKQAGITAYKHLTAILKYKCQDKITSPMYLFKAKYLMYNNNDENYQLSNVCEKQVQVTEVDGDHLTMLHQSSLSDGINKIIT